MVEYPWRFMHYTTNHKSRINPIIASCEILDEFPEM